MGRILTPTRASLKRVRQVAGERRDSEDMTRLSSRSDERDTLEALKASRRELELSVHLEQLLGSGGGPAMGGTTHNNAGAPSQHDAACYQTSIR